MDHAIIPITLPSPLPTPSCPGRTEAAVRVCPLLSPISSTSPIPIRTLHTSHWGSHPTCLFDHLSVALQVPGTTRWAAQAGIAWWDPSQVQCPPATPGESWQHTEQGARCACASLHRSRGVCQLGMCLQLGITLAAVRVLAQELNNCWEVRERVLVGFSWCLGWQCCCWSSSERDGWQPVLPFCSWSLGPGWMGLRVLQPLWERLADKKHPQGAGLLLLPILLSQTAAQILAALGKR